ncbi:MAG: dihydrodipicolinate synthase family protein [Pseudohongiellaceae bacterium]
MTMARCDGVFAPVITPFTEALEIDLENYLHHCRWLQSQGAGLAVFGTNSEAASLGLAEKLEALEALVANGIDPARLMPGTGSCALPDTVALTRKAMSLGCAGVLMLPPYYYKNVSDDGLYSYFAEVIDRVADARLRIYLYHIPAVSGVAISHPLIERLAHAYPEQIAGIKDSSGDAAHLAQLNELQVPDFRVFCGSESLLLENLRQGGAGCISATANVNPGPIRALFTHWQDEDAESRQQQLNQVRELFQRFPMIPALKTVVGEFSARPGWSRVRPPLLPLPTETRRKLLDEIRGVDFQMPDI